ncbi:hypothetical protein ACVW00_000679 [Marmoricola sp. URHA0025 HA25]
MNPTTSTTTTRIHAVGEQVFGPVLAPRGSLERRILLARSAFAYGGLITTLVQVVVWLTIAVLTGHLDSPWWLWTTVPAAAAVAGLTIADRWHTWWATASAR